MTNTANPKANITSQWFALSVQPGLEKSTAQALQKRVPGVDEAVVPSETLKKNNRLGQKITVDKLIFPGYAFVKAQLQDEGGAMNTVVYDRVLAVVRRPRFRRIGPQHNGGTGHQGRSDD